jgi:iron(III) transport system ATP-binding protein
MSEARRPLVVERLSHRYGDLRTLIDVDLSVDAGTVVSVLGPSGSGKTTLLRSIAGFASPDAGKIVIGGVPVFEAGRELVVPERRRVGMVFQDYALFPHLNVLDNVAFGIHRDPQRQARVEELLERMGLSGLQARRPAELSGGQQQRVALARALAPRPALLLLDEPFAGLDAERRIALLRELRRIIDAERASALLVTHNREEALAVSDRVAVLGESDGGGRLLQLDAPEGVYRRPSDLQVARTTGEAQWIEGRADGDVAETALGPVPLVQPRTGPVRLLVRPESLAFTVAEVDGDCTVLERQFAGAGYRLWCRTPAGDLGLECPEATAPDQGARGKVEVRGALWALPSTRSPE